MSKFRSNHYSNSKTSAYLLKNLFIVVLIISIILIGLSRIMKSIPRKETNVREKIYTAKDRMGVKDKFFQSVKDRNFIPKSSNTQVIHHNYYSLGYSNKMEQALWVAYELTKKSIQIPNVKRYNWFMQDAKVKGYSSEYADYTHSIYSRGHIAPAGDMAFNALAMKESFLMSNISPQLKKFNEGIWNELEKAVRDWAYGRRRIVVASGPVFYDDSIEFIGKNKVAVPHAFYKAILDMDKKESIAFVLPHYNTDLPISEFAVSVNELEQEIGIDFFSSYFSSKKEEEKVESHFEIIKWKFNLKKWND